MYKLLKSPISGKKWRVELPNGKHVDFGAKGYQDFTMHRDTERMRRYIIRHQKRENWTKSGVGTAGFWSRWILWSAPSFEGAVRKTEKIIGNKIIF
jgi:hypothetical protein